MDFTREEILKQLMQSSVSIESVTVDAKKSEPYPKLAGS